jgi:hypothetical protein
MNFFIAEKNNYLKKQMHKENNYQHGLQSPAKISFRITEEIIAFKKRAKQETS